MFKRFIVKLGSFVTIADVFGYVLVSLIACSLWIGYQKAENISSRTATLAKNQVEPIGQSIRFKLKEFESASSSVGQIGELKNDNKVEVGSKNSETGFNSYLSKIKSTLGIFNMNTAKKTVGSLNASVNEVLTGVTTDLTEDPRSITFGKGTPKNRNPHHKAEVRDSLAPF